MRLKFVATQAGFEADEYALVWGVAGEQEYLTFQRDSEGAREDWGVYLEYADQSNGEYGCVAGCRLSRNSLSVDLAHQLGRLSGVTGFDVTLDIDDDVFEPLPEGLRRVFRGHEDSLRLE